MNDLIEPTNLVYCLPSLIKAHIGHKSSKYLGFNLYLSRFNTKLRASQIFDPIPFFLPERDFLNLFMHFDYPIIRAYEILYKKNN